MQENKKKYSIIKSFLKSYWVLSDNVKAFFIQGSFFAVFMLLISYLLGQKYMCFFNKGVAQNMYCPNASLLFIVYFLLKLFAISVAVNVWYNSVFKKAEISLAYFKSNVFKFLKSFVCILLFVVLNAMPMVSSLILFNRVPNPVWQKELMFFIIVSTGFWVPFILMRFYGLFAAFLAGENWKQFKKIWEKTSGFTMKIVISCAFVFMVDLVALISVFGTFSRPSNLPAELYNMSAEVSLAFAAYFIVITFLNFIEFQKNTFLDDNK